MSYFLRFSAKRAGLSLVIHEVDILRHKKHDLAKLSNQQMWLQKLAKHEYDILLTSPPCSTFTRAVWSNRLGPCPVRSAVHPRGFKWLSFLKKKMANLGNILADFSYQAMHTMLEHNDTIAVMEQPEDLGANKSGPWPGVRPASMWQFPQFENLLKLQNVRSAAFYQSEFGTPYAKPTRFLFRLNCKLPDCLFLGKPSFDERGFYVGPLPPLKKKMTSLQRQGHEAGFRTTGTAAWPPELCKWLSQACIDSFTNTENGAVKLVCKTTTQSVDTTSSPPVDFKATSTFPDSTTVVDSKDTDDLILMSSYNGTANGQMPLTSYQGGINDSDQTTWVPADTSPTVQNTGLVPGVGKPRSCVSILKTSLFHDGAGLLSPGRWDWEKRNYPGGNFDHLREGLHDYVENYFGSKESWQKACLALAVSKKNIFDKELIDTMRKYLANWCVANNPEGRFTMEQLLTIDDGQPFYLQLLKAVLESAKDGDYMFLEQARHGLPVGVLHELPRTPLMYEEQTSWRLEDDPSQTPLLLVENYTSAEQHAQHVYDFFEQEIEEGLMGKMEEQDFFEKFGVHTAVAALAVLEEKNGKRRIIHDATHGVRVNHRIRCLDKQRMPGPKEKFHLLRKYKERNEVVFSLLADVSKAHRRFKHLETEWGYLACKVKSSDSTIYYNKVGTFGVASASYWWGRIFAAIIRAVHYLLGKGFPIDMLIYADDVECLGLGKDGRRGIVLAFMIMDLFSTPFKWEKTRGGLQTDWIGLHTDYRRYMLGLSQSRAKWLTDWCREVAKDQRILPRVFAAGLGRLCFSANALMWERPFLGPLFAWSSAVAKLTSEVRVPWAVCFILLYLANRFEKGDRLMPPPSTRIDNGILFKTDARADEEEAWVGGWEPHQSGDLKKSRWFALQVTRDWAPWAFIKNNPQRLIASLELLGTLLGVIFFSDKWSNGSRGSVVGRAITDNLGNSFIVSKQMTTKFPVTLLLMEMTEWLRELDLVLNLQWVPREQNNEADALSNMDTKDFDENHRIDIVPEKIPWKILNELLVSSTELYNLVIESKQTKTPSTRALKKPKRIKLLDEW